MEEKKGVGRVDRQTEEGVKRQTNNKKDER